MPSSVRRKKQVSEKLKRKVTKLYAIEVNGLTKYYSHGKIKALEDVALQVNRGIIFSLLGPNGAGKTTLIKLLLGIAYPGRGSAKILGMDISDYKSHYKIGYLAENHKFPDFLTPRQVLNYFGKMAGLKQNQLDERTDRLLDTVGLSDWKNIKIKKFSKGMMQRVGIAQALINDPELLFFDEPTDGVDPVGRREIRDLLQKLRDQGKTIFLNSHLLSEVERISDEIAILKNGKLLEKGSVQDFISVNEQYQIYLNHKQEKMEAICNTLQIQVMADKDFSLVKVNDESHLNQLIDELRKNRVTIKAIIPRKISLEDFFIDVVEAEEGK